MFFWAVMSDEIDRVIEFFPSRWQAERMLAEALHDEPDWRGILRVDCGFRLLPFRSDVICGPSRQLRRLSPSTPAQQGASPNRSA